MKTTIVLFSMKLMEELKQPGFIVIKNYFKKESGVVFKKTHLGYKIIAVSKIYDRNIVY